MAYLDNAYGNEVTVLKYDGSTWSTVGSARGASPGGADSASLAIDPSDVPYVACSDSTNDYKATVMKYDSSTSSWTAVGSVGFSAGAASVISLAISPSGVPYVAFEDDANSGKVTVMKYEASSSTWKTLGRAGISSGLATFNSLVIDSSGVPYVAFTDSTNYDKASVMRFR